MSDSDDEYTIIRKRVGGGYKDVRVKNPAPERRDNRTEDKLSGEIGSDGDSEHEKQDMEMTEKDELTDGIQLPVPRKELRSSNSCDGNIRYEDYPILRYIQDNVIGHNLIIDGPFGPKKEVYCDYTASGRALSFIEDYIRDYVLPLYANTHSETGRNARQTQKFREEARSIIKRCVNAGKDDVVIFTGSGSTAGIHKLAWSLKINQPRVAEETVVITGPFEHHSNVLIWKELGTTVVRLKENEQGTVDIDVLEKELKFWKEKKRQMLVSISAASNVTGITIDTEEVARVSHRHGALVAFDFAGGGPYLKIDMNSSKQSYKDAVYISPHKFVGGPGSPGILIAKKWMFKNQIPDRVGGGTVVYVTRDTHMYASNIEGREEGGTPAIVESIRTGLAFLLKDAVTESVIGQRDEDLCCRAFAVWEQNPNLVILGNHSAERVTIFSFVVKHAETGKFIHYNFISTLLNDLFGIQSRGGCACAGPYVHDLLGITETMAKRLKWFVDEHKGKTSHASHSQLAIMRPGFVRVNLPYFYDDETVDYIIKAVDMVATHGWKLLPMYTFDTSTGNFKHKGNGSSRTTHAQTEEDMLFSLQDIDYSSYGKFHVNREPPKVSNEVTFDSMMADAEKVFEEALDEMQHLVHRPSTASRDLHEVVPKDRQKLRWFMTPQEVINYVTGIKRIRHFKPIMTPRMDFREKEWNSAPESSRPRLEGLGSTQRAKDDMYTNKIRTTDRGKSQIEKLPPLDLDRVKDRRMSTGYKKGHNTNIDKNAKIFKNNTTREGYSTHHNKKEYAEYESDTETYLNKDSDNRTKIEDLENTWPRKQRQRSRDRRAPRDSKDGYSQRYHAANSSVPRRGFDTLRLPEIG